MSTRAFIGGLASGLQKGAEMLNRRKQAKAEEEEKARQAQESERKKAEERNFKLGIENLKYSRELSKEERARKEKDRIRNEDRVLKTIGGIEAESREERKAKEKRKADLSDWVWKEEYKLKLFDVKSKADFEDFKKRHLFRKENPLVADKGLSDSELRTDFRWYKERMTDILFQPKNPLADSETGYIRPEQLKQGTKEALEYAEYAEQRERIITELNKRRDLDNIIELDPELYPLD